MAEKGGSSRFGRRRSRILYQITALIVVLLVVAGLIVFFVIDNSFDRLIEKSTDKLLEEEARIINNALEYIAGQLVEELVGDIEALDLQELQQMFMESFQSGEPSEVMLAGNERITELVESGVLGLELIIDGVLPIPPVVEQATIVISSDESLVLEPLPDSLVSAIEDGEDYLFMEEGFAEFGLEGEYLVSFFDMSEISRLLTGYWGVHFVPMGDAIADIQEFYNSEKNRASLILALIIGGTILIVFLITFFMLSFLIRKQITQPIDELSAAAEEVMEGNLDVDIEVREGEEFEGLKRAFKEMVESFRKYIAKSTGEE